jgi:hypothetical protein
MSLSLALRHDGRKCYRMANEQMANITEDHLPRSLDICRSHHGRRSTPSGRQAPALSNKRKAAIFAGNSPFD